MSRTSSQGVHQPLRRPGSTRDWLARHIDRDFLFLFVDRCFSVKPRPTAPSGINSVCLQVEKDSEVFRRSFNVCEGARAPKSISVQTFSARSTRPWTWFPRWTRRICRLGTSKGSYSASCSIQASNRSPPLPPTVFSAIGRQHAPECRDAQQIDSGCG